MAKKEEPIDIRAVPGYHYYYVSPQKRAVYDSRKCAWRYPFMGHVRLCEGLKHEWVHIDEVINRSFGKKDSEAFWEALDDCSKALRAWNDEQEKKYWEEHRGV